MSKPQVMLVSIALTAATVCTARACTKRLDDTMDWDETYWAETETYCSKTRPETHQSKIETRPRRWGFCPRRDRDKTLVRIETETSRPRPHPCFLI